MPIEKVAAASKGFVVTLLLYCNRSQTGMIVHGCYTAVVERLRPARDYIMFIAVNHTSHTRIIISIMAHRHLRRIVFNEVFAFDCNTINANGLL